jgi:thiamine biosynthesis lipoprotein
MTPGRLSSLLLAGVLVASVSFSAPATPPALVRLEATRLSMGSAYSIIAHGDSATLPGTLESAFDEVDRIDRLMSHYKPESPLSRLNREAAAGPVPVEAELFDFLAEALRYGRDSGGAFDITVGPLMKAWGFFRGGGRVPSEAELQAARAGVGYRHVILNAADHTVAFDRPGVALDLGGIAKGYAVDRVVLLLRRAGVPAALVSAGGSTVYALGAPPGEEGWPVEIDDPADPGAVAFRTRLRDRALSVSGSAEKSFQRDGVTYSHIMDPRTGRPVQGMLGVAVLAETGTAGDALDDVFFVLGVEASRRYLRAIPHTEALLFQPRGAGWTVTGLRGPRTRPAHFSGGRSTMP